MVVPVGFLYVAVWPDVLRADVERLVPNELLDVVAVFLEVGVRLVDDLCPATALPELETVS